MNLNDLKNEWIQDFASPMIIAGPCSAESESQMLETAKRLKWCRNLSLPCRNLEA